MNTPTTNIEMTDCQAGYVVAPEGLGSPDGYYTPTSRAEMIAWLRGRQTSAHEYARATGSQLPRFWGRALQFVCTTENVPTVQPDEIVEIIRQHRSDAERLAALERLARPRLAYKWQQAGGPRWQQSFPELSDADVEIGRAYYRNQFEKLLERSA